MRGSIHLRSDVKHPWWFIKWYVRSKPYYITLYRGQRMYQTNTDEKRDYGYELVKRLRSEMRADFERGIFNIANYVEQEKTDVIKLYERWLKTKLRKKPNTYKAYESYFKCWIKPFFQKYNYMLSEIQLDVLYELLDFIDLGPKGKWNVMTAFHTFCKYAWRSRRIPEMPPFPTRDEYGILKPKPEWLTQEELEKILAQIPEPQLYPFLWLLHHYRRPGEACALMKSDFDVINSAFVIRRAISARQLVESTKTSKIHYVPCKSEFISIARKLLNKDLDSPFLFVNPRARRKTKRYTLESLRNIWYKACDAACVKRIWVYRGTKHTACTHFIEAGGTIDELQMLTDHSDKRSLEHYAEITLNRKRSLMERGTVVEFKKVTGQLRN